MTLQQKIILYVAVFLSAYLSVFLIDLYTVNYEVETFTGETDEVFVFQGDQSDYVKLAEDGGISDGDVLGPFAYRMIPAIIAAFFAQVFDMHVVYGYQWLTFIGLGLQLVMVFILSREIGTNIWQSFFIMLVVALTYNSVRMMTYDFIRPDAIALAGILGIVWLILRGHLGWAMVLSWVGVAGREYFLILSAIISAYYLWRTYEAYQESEKRQQIWKPLLLMIVSSLGAIAVFMTPRLLIPVPETYQFIETTGQDSLWEGILFILGSVGRNKNYIMAFVGYLFPSILLFSFLRFPRLTSDIKRVGALVFLYSAGIMFLSYIGGLDFLRFTSYMVVTQVIILAVLLKNGVMLWELVFLIGLWGWYNRIHQALPGVQEDFSGYIIFNSPWGMDVPQVISNRFELAVALIVTVWVVRFIWIGTQNWRNHGALFAINPEPEV